MVKSSNSQTLDSFFVALANKHRRNIINVLSLQPQSISNLASMNNLSLPAIHKHIKILENSGLITRKKTGRVTFLTLNRDSLRSLQHWLNQHQTFWGTDKETLENYTQYLQKKK